MEKINMPDVKPDENKLPFDDDDWEVGREEFERAIEEYGGYRDED